MTNIRALMLISTENTNGIKRLKTLKIHLLILVTKQKNYQCKFVFEKPLEI